KEGGHANSLGSRLINSTHSLKYFYTALPQSTGLPEFSAVTYLDEEPIYFYDSSSKEVVSRQEWVKGDVDPDFWRRNTQILMATEKVFKVNIDTARDCFNQTREDFLIFDLKNERWIAPVRQGLPTKIKWDANVPQLKANIHYLTHTCIEWLKKYVSYQRRMLQRTVSPQVTLLQKEPSNPVTCHATGFYPNAIMIFWGRDGVEIHDDVVHEETRFNGMGRIRREPISLCPLKTYRSTSTHALSNTVAMMWFCLLTGTAFAETAGILRVSSSPINQISSQGPWEF
uniref:Ig-like domain-containing protein n=1 Tax=Hucho hucho TaxID=62062 RepID=A0A4W5R7Y3_9TELE